MVEPGRFVDAIAHLQKDVQILGAQIELSNRSSEVKTLLRWQFPLRIFSSVPAPFQYRLRRLKPDGLCRATPEPCHSLTFFQHSRSDLWPCRSDRVGKDVQHFCRFVAHC